MMDVGVQREQLQGNHMVQHMELAKKLWRQVLAYSF